MAKEKIKIWKDEQKQDIKFPILLKNLEDFPFEIKSLEDINLQEGDDFYSIAVPGGLRAFKGLDVNGNAIKDLINEKLNTQTKQILGDFTFGTFGAIKIITDNNNGVWISPVGILGKKAGITTFALTNTGDATFRGTITASNITGGTILGSEIIGGTITGALIRTATSGKRIEIRTEGSYAHHIIFYGDNNYPKLSIYENIIAWPTNPWLISNITDLLEIRFPVPAADRRSLFFTKGTRADVRMYASPGTPIEISTLIPSGANNLGSSTYRWRHLYLSGNVYANGNIQAPINTTRTSYSGHFLPAANRTYDLGSSGRKWQRVYRRYEFGCPLPTSNSALEIFEKIKKPRKRKGDYGNRHYFRNSDFPDEMKVKTDEKKEPEIELTQTLGVTVQAVKELIEKVKNLEKKVDEIKIIKTKK